MTPNRPYLIRAIYEWIVDNQLTPYLLVDADGDGVVVPIQYIEDGRIVLNIGPSAVHGMRLANDMIEFSARFGGQAMQVLIPPAAVQGIYARENGKGMLFPDEDDDGDDTSPDSPNQGGTGRPNLKVVK